MPQSFGKTPPAGVWCPAVTLFRPNTTDEIDFSAQSLYFTYLGQKTGLAGLVVLGTNAETFLLTREERKQLLILARKSVGPDVPIIAGVGGHSVKQVKEFISDAEEAGADYLLVLPPGYFGKATTRQVIEEFYADVCRATRKGVVVYNFPGVCNGVDLDSEMIASLVKKHPNIVGVKLTCGSVAKITRLAAEFPPDRFAVFAGQSDFLLGGLAVGSAGCVAAFANVFPKTIVKIYKLYKEGKTEEALKLHGKAALAEQALKNGGIAATKYAASLFTAPAAGIERAEERMRPRRPYLAPTEEEKKRIREGLEVVAGFDRGL
ncbi:hypothetical protein QBC35DRAFT_489064 [Podospora australis]|uniref:4-hydroxy-2-oxoglutarate aldolase, mitochondrial n=1 Tax=Podospora australis TaxID=1536484 RepID=A0AAN7AKS1_9PEZI|nr:hypothetical protein QBC35DRAFT_489064 [Podospora australis]